MFGIDMLRTHSLSLERPWGAPLGNSLWELRIRSRRQLRVYILPTLEGRLFWPRFREATADHVVKRPGKFNSPFRAMMPHYLTHRL
jgi:hypothetical protein